MTWQQTGREAIYARRREETAYLLSEVEFLRSQGMTWAYVTTALGVSAGALAVRLRRAGYGGDIAGLNHLEDAA